MADHDHRSQPHAKLHDRDWWRVESRRLGTDWSGILALHSDVVAACMNITIITTPSRCGRYTAWLGDRVLAHSRQPFLDAARELIALGCDPSAILLLRHAGSATVALRATVGGAARLTVDEDPRPRFRRWRAWDRPPPIAGDTPAPPLDRSRRPDGPRPPEPRRQSA
jgi:hypothetical protein